MATGQQVARVIDSQDEYYDLERMRAMKESAHEAWALDHGKKHTESEFYRSFHEKYQTGYLVHMKIMPRGHIGCGCLRDPWHKTVLNESAVIFFPHIYPTEFPLDETIQLELANSLLQCEVWPTGMSRVDMEIRKVEPGCISQARTSPNESVATLVAE